MAKQRGVRVAAGVTTMHTRDAVGIGAPQTGVGLSRRTFLAAGGLGAAWVLLSGPLGGALAATAREAARCGAAFANLQEDQARTLAAVMDRILPAVDGLPGATAAGAVHFADLALAGPAAELARPLFAGLADLDARARATHPGATGYADLAPAEQDELLHAVEKTPFFGVAFAMTIFGTLAAPSHGGNRDGVGWKLVQIEPRMRWQPPFGWYDAQWRHEHPEAAS